MLSQLSIKNFGLIDDVAIEFVAGLNVLTGSTGAGKSIIIDGLRFALGERINPAQIRDPAFPCLVEAVFDLTPDLLAHCDALNDFLSAEDLTLIIQRQYTPEGRTRIKINGQAVTINQLKDIGRALIDFHGPHDHQLLLSQDAHIGILDQLSDFGNDRPSYTECFQRYTSLQQRIRELSQLALSRERDIEILEYQVTELSQVPLDEAEYEKICQDISRINNAEKLYENAAAVLRLFDDEQGVSSHLSQIFKPLRILNQVDESTTRFTELVEQLQDQGEQLTVDMRAYLDSLAFEPGAAEQIKKRYDLYDEIRRKYGPDLASARAVLEERQAKLELLKDLDHNDAQLKVQVKEAEKELRRQAQKLTRARQKTADGLKAVIEQELKDLGIAHVSFEARITREDFHKDGWDRVTFYISPNLGEDMKPLAQIVSSGEAARVMLALKRALVNVDPVPVLIFDEIDAQIGGRLGAVTGKKLKSLSENRQVILITHLPQIAAFADEHFKVIKQVGDGRTTTAVAVLDKKARVEELAHMMSGDTKGPTAVRHAEELLSEAAGV